MKIKSGPEAGVSRRFRHAAFIFERKSLFWKIYAAMIFALIVPVLLFNAHRYYIERQVGRAGEGAVIERIHDWSSRLSEMADGLPDENLPSWIGWMERESGLRFYVVRNGETFRALGRDDRAYRSLGTPTVEDVSESGRTRVVVALRPPRRPPPGYWHVRNLGFLIVVIGGVALSFLIVRSFKEPVDELRNVTNRLAEGDLSVRVGKDVMERGAEISDLANAFNAMAERVEDLVTRQKRLLADISHEIRSPLQRLVLSLALARENATDRSEPYFDRADTEILRINEMLEELLVITRAEMTMLEKDRVDIEEILYDIVDDAEFEGRPQGKTIQTKIEPLIVRGDPTSLKRVLGNVVNNAIRYTPENTEVRVTARREGNVALIEVQDSGCGVQEEELEKIFLPYYRTDVARERPRGGTGLGLAITKRLVENLGGTISAFNAPSGGLCVSIRLPLSRGGENC